MSPDRAPRRLRHTASVVRLRYHPPYAWAYVLGFLRTRAIEGVEQVIDDRYLRSVRHAGAVGWVEVRHAPHRAGVEVAIGFPCRRALPAIVARVRRVFDLDADHAPVAARLAEDPLLAPLIQARPGLRIPGGWDGFELGVRAVLGQQVTVEAARRLGAQLVALCGVPLPAAARRASAPALTRVFPGPAEVVAAELGRLGMPRSRQATLRALAEAALADPQLFARGDGLDTTIDRLCAIRGIGAWTAHYIALRVVREPDAFPASDVGLLRGATGADGVRPTADQLAARAERWRPWRGLAAQHLWAADAAR